MIFADELKRAIGTAPRITLPGISSLLWKAYADGQVSEAEAEELAALIEIQKIVPAPLKQARRSVGSRPRTDESLERRRVWAASGRFPPSVARHFTPAEQAVLAVVAAEFCREGDCRLTVGGIAGLAGVSETSVRNAMREAVARNLVAVEERRLTRWRNDTNIVRIVSREWTVWLRIAKGRREPKVLPELTGEASTDAVPASWGGCRPAKGSNTVSSRTGNSGDRKRRKAAEKQGRGTISALAG
ncbi:hypothetical protein ABID43_004889 [Methylobacterium goesingense]|uniref:Helix-turn-helix domain-containing protein n=2 Tax=Methylobacterium goesingense TaxID=243690 RepID=A0ABV2LBU2_9HYPH